MTPPMRRVGGRHSIRLDGIIDLEARARGASVLDIGCNRGLVGYQMYLNGATKIHGCDVDAACIAVCRQVFIDLRDCESRFEVVDLRGGAAALHASFGDVRYDITLMLATYHKLKRVTDGAVLSALMRHFGERTDKFFGWRGTGHEPEQNELEMAALDADLGAVGLKRVHTSYISTELGVAAIWAR
jgi:SAM-dependent methyltransferase